MNKKINRFTGIFFSPYVTFKDIDEKPTFLPAMIVIFLIGAISSVLALLYAPIEFTDLLNVLLDKYGIEFYNYMKNILQASSQVTLSPVTIVSTSLVSFISILVMYLISSLFLFLFLLVLKGNIKYKKIFVSNLYIGIIIGIIGIAMISLQYILKTSQPIFSLAVFMPNGNFTMPLYNILRTIDLANIYSAVLTGLMIGAMTDFSKKKIIIVTLIIFAVNVILAFVMFNFQNLSYEMTYNAFKLTMKQ